MVKFSEASIDKWKHITTFEGEFYPDVLDVAEEKYKEILETFYQLAKTSSSSKKLLVKIQDQKNNRINLLKLFRRFVSPCTSVEMLKRKKNLKNIQEWFGASFRDLQLVITNLEGINKEAICLSLYETDHRANSGYQLVNSFSTWCSENLRGYEIKIPNKDIEFSDLYPTYSQKCPCDFVFFKKEQPVLVGFCRYDTDRGGSQEDDRIEGNKAKAQSINQYMDANVHEPIKILFLNDGPGLLLGSMWEDYGLLEDKFQNVRVATLKMLDSRLTSDWIENERPRDLLGIFANAIVNRNKTMLRMVMNKIAGRIDHDEIKKLAIALLKRDIDESKTLIRECESKLLLQ